MAGVAFAVEGDGVGFATESYAASALYTTLASLSCVLSRIRRDSARRRLRSAARDRRAGNSSRVECGSSESGGSVRSFPEFGDDTAPRAHAPCPYPQATWPDRRQRKTSHCLREALAGARR